MENLIKTKKLETRFFLTTAAQQNNNGQPSATGAANNNNAGPKPQTAAASFSKSKVVNQQVMGKDFLNSTAPLNFHNITIMGGNGGRGGSHNPPGTAVGGARININGGGP